MPGWTIPADELARIDFGAVAELAREPIAAPTYAVPKSGAGALSSEIPGEALPDPLKLHPQQVPCTESLPTLRQAIRAWEQERDQLDGAPAAAEDRESFLRILAQSTGLAPFATRGATWVSPKPLWLLFEAGFCSIEHERYADAVRWLESAVEMAPDVHSVRMELVHALLSLREIDHADSLLDFTFSHSQDRCQLAGAWRQRGYIRFEQRRLEESRDAYLRSLEYDPNSALARSELAGLAHVIEQNGGNPKWYVPPASKTQLTVCDDT
jgi:tetratricopeptide (TPR) repeat protein